jgi:aminoglycoside phosphotransferase (APT) family kinase protein
VLLVLFLSFPSSSACGAGAGIVPGACGERSTPVALDRTDSPGPSDPNDPPDPLNPPGLDLPALARHLDAACPGLVSGPLRATLISGGRSNLTFDLTDGKQRWALRRPPLGHVLPTAHDMAREYRVLSALADSPVPVPRTVLLSTDNAVPAALGAPFYLMDFVPGRVLRTPDQAPDAPRLRRLAVRLVDTLATLHSVDPIAVGLADFGRPDGFLLRQVERWSGQLARSRSRDVPGLDELSARLGDAVPVSQQVAIVHGDFRLANTIVGEDDDRIAAVLDWEMSTLGDPLVDVAALRLYSQSAQADGPDGQLGSGVHEIPLPGIDSLLVGYSVRTGLDLAPLPWYSAFAHFKLAAILEGIHYRHALGQTVGSGFDRIGARVPPLVAAGLAILDTGW